MFPELFLFRNEDNFNNAFLTAGGFYEIFETFACDDIHKFKGITKALSYFFVLKCAVNLKNTKNENYLFKK